VMRYLMCALMMSATLEAAAQESTGAVYVAAGVSFADQAALQAGSPPPFAAPGGNTLGWLAGGGVFVSPRLSIDIDVSRTGVMHARQAGRHNTSEVSTRRDWFVSFGVKGHLPFAVHIEPVAGIALVGNEGTFASFSGESRGYYPLAWNPGIAFGADVRVGGRRLAFVPGFRFVFTGVPNGTTCDIGFTGEPLCRQGEPRWEWHYPRWTQGLSLALGVNF
jgi:hypothetical protein